MKTGRALVVGGAGLVAAGTLATIEGHQHYVPNTPECQAEPLACPSRPGVYVPGALLGAVGVGLVVGSGVVFHLDAKDEPALVVRGTF